MSTNRNLPLSAKVGMGLMIAIALKAAFTWLGDFSLGLDSSLINGVAFFGGFIAYSLGKVPPIRTFCGTCLSVGGVALAIAVYYNNPLGVQSKVDHTTYLWIHFQIHQMQYMCGVLMLMSGWFLGTLSHETIFGREEDFTSVPEDSTSSVEHEP